MGIAMFSIMVFHQMWFYGHVIDNFFYYYGSWGRRFLSVCIWFWHSALFTKE